MLRSNGRVTIRYGCLQKKIEIAAEVYFLRMLQAVVLGGYVTDGTVGWLKTVVLSGYVIDSTVGWMCYRQYYGYVPAINGVSRAILIDHKHLIDTREYSLKVSLWQRLPIWSNP